MSRKLPPVPQSLCLTVGARCSSQKEETSSNGHVLLHKRIPNILCTEHESNDKVFGKVENKWKLMLNISKKQVRFLGHVVRKECLKNLILTGRIVSKEQRKNNT